jgi:hypothetical protein
MPKKRILNNRDFKMSQRTKTKRPFCTPTHLSEGEFTHVSEQAFERGWSNSAYIRSLVIADKQRHEDELNFRATASGLPIEHFELFDHSVRFGRRKGDRK